jgi:hypothetical protein
MHVACFSWKCWWGGQLTELWQGYSASVDFTQWTTMHDQIWNLLNLKGPEAYMNFMSSIFTCGPFLHRIPTIQRRKEGTYLSIEMYQWRESLLMGATNKKFTQHLLLWPQGRSTKKGTVCLVLHKDHNERLNESKLENDNKRVGSLRQPLST